MLVSRSGYLGEAITEGTSADPIIPNASSDSISTLVSLLDGGSSTVTHGIYAGLQSLCHSLDRPVPELRKCGSPAAAASCLLLNTVDIDHDVNVDVFDVMLTLR